MKYFFYILITISQFSFAQPDVEQLQSKLDKLLSEIFFESTIASVDIYDLTDSKVLYQKNEKFLLRPASNMKILTSAAGLLFLGEDYNFKTSLYYTGKIVGQTLYGDIYIVGGCDPDFTSKDLDSLVGYVSGLGITEISGDLVGDVSMIDSIFWGNGWMWDDDPSTDAPYLTALNINDNSINVTVSASEPGLPAEVSVEPETGYVTVKNNSITIEGAENDFIVDRDWLNRENAIIVSGEVSSSYKSSVARARGINVFKPELYFLTLFNESLSDAGIKLNGSLKFSTLPENSNPVFSYERLYDSVLVNLNKTSDNLSAEMTLRAIAEKYYGKPATAENGVKLIDSLIFVSGNNPEIYRIVDGSGLSHYNLISAELLLSVLKYFYNQHPDLYSRLYNSFPIAGVDGTLKNRMKGTLAFNNVHAKTGTISGVSSLSGYVTSARGNTIAFSIMIQNYVKNTSTAKKYEDEICKILAEY